MSLSSAATVALRLGRVSNLPTVWTNTLVGVTLAGASAFDPRVPALLVAMSLFYVGGMFLNDAFDRDFDARSRPDRPIPAGQITAGAVFGAGFGMLGAGLLLLIAAGFWYANGTGWRAPVFGIALAAAIVLYDSHHKNNPLSPVLMGMCRMLVYITSALAISLIVPSNLVIAAVVVLSYLIGLTYVAKREHLNELGSLWPLGALAVSMIYGVILALNAPLVWSFLLLFVGVGFVCIVAAAPAREGRCAAGGGEPHRGHLAAGCNPIVCRRFHWPGRRRAACVRIDASAPALGCRNLNERAHFQLSKLAHSVGSHVCRATASLAISPLSVALPGV